MLRHRAVRTTNGVTGCPSPTRMNGRGTYTRALAVGTRPTPILSTQSVNSTEKSELCVVMEVARPDVAKPMTNAPNKKALANIFLRFISASFLTFGNRHQLLSQAKADRVADRNRRECLEQKAWFGPSRHRPLHRSPPDGGCLGRSGAPRRVTARGAQDATRARSNSHQRMRSDRARGSSTFPLSPRHRVLR